ncbi:MAG TPA: enoyl-CoA hydratase [Candidatus Eisenbacteria bacterium]|nr:enoyl-CoA hydratase [Candidatus Eisenbacteria bacterium]
MPAAVVTTERLGTVVRITMNRPEARNAQSTGLILALDDAMRAAAADEAVRVVILAAAGPSFSAGHDLKPVVGQTKDDAWRKLRRTPEGRLRHERELYVEKCLAIYHLPKPVIAQVQGHCVAAGLMLAAMCDLIVAADDAVFSNPVLRMTGAGVELLVEPWELGLRKAKEFLWTGDAIDAREAWRLGLVNRVVPRRRLAAETLALAERIALVPPVTASLVKESLNQTAALMGKEHAWRYHFMVHQFMHGTKTAQDALRARRKTGSVRAMLAERDRKFARAGRKPR